MFNVTVRDAQPGHAGDLAQRTPRREVADGPDELAWCTPQEAAALPLMPFTAELLGRPTPSPPTGLPVEPEPAGSTSIGGRAAGRRAAGDRRQRFSAYGLVTDPDERVLLTMIAPGYPGAGLWHLPGGGTDHGEQPADGLLRELVEESGQRGRVDRPDPGRESAQSGRARPRGPADWTGTECG